MPSDAFSVVSSVTTPDLAGYVLGSAHVSMENSPVDHIPIFSRPLPSHSLTSEKLISTRAAAERLSVSRSTLWKLLSTGQIPYVALNGRRCIRIPEQALEQFLLSRVQPASMEATA